MTTEFGTRRISLDLSDLYREEREAGGKQLFYDVVIVGSGYGGAMAAAELAGRKTWDGHEVKVLVLERGKEYVPGMFPSSAQEMPSHVRVHRSQSGETTGYHDGLFDIRIGPDVCALVGNGLGGGSLINAGVMEVPDWKFVPRMPKTLKNYLNANTFLKIKQSLGAASVTGRPSKQPGKPDETDNTIELHTRTSDGTAKTKALKSLNPGKFRYPALTVEMLEDAELPRCELCGDCMTGCNVGAKKSLDTNLLLTAFKLGAHIRTGASVKSVKLVESVEPAAKSGPWEVAVVFTGESLRRRHKPLRIRAGNVILAAGTLGSPEILMQSQRFALKFSPRLGQQFSCNGDNILAVQGAEENTNSVAREHDKLQGRTIGPTITGIVDVEQRDSGPPFMIQEFAVPAALKRIFDEAVTTSSLLHQLAEEDSKDHVAVGSGTDPLAVNQEKMDKVLLLGLIGHDESSGRLKLPVLGPMEDPRVAEGRIQIDWPDLKRSRMLDDAYDRAKKLILEQPSKLPVLANPLWRMLPEQLDFVFRSERGPVLTVHPLGGCAIGRNRNLGVVDEFGRVFDYGVRKGVTSVHHGLWVMDGSILPSSLGANPALTIAAVARRAARRLARDCRWVKPDATSLKAASDKQTVRPRSRTLDQCTPAKPVVTEVELIEKLCGEFRLGAERYQAELTLQYVPKGLHGLTTQMDRLLTIHKTELSTLRIYELEVWNEKGVRFLDERARHQHALLVAPIEKGGLKLLQREPSRWWWRAIRGVAAYVINRGMRDLWSSWHEFLARPNKLKRLIALASHAGEVRRFDYDLTLGPPTKGQGTELARRLEKHPRIQGEKRFTYSIRSNPWRQLMELQTTRFLGVSARSRPMLQLDGRFIARQAVPLARIVVQENQVQTLGEMAAFALVLVRLCVSIHLWSFRAPDPMPSRKRTLLPGPVKGLPDPEVIEIELEPPRHGIPVLVRLTRYKGKNACTVADTTPPLVLLHGYSASGTTFTHKAIPDPMARYFWEKGRDIWILDLRTSAGMPSALLPWNFEDAALADIPVAIARILAVTRRKQVDVFAHCIGAVMLSMAVLTEGPVKGQAQWKQINDVDPADGVQARRYDKELAALPGAIRRIVLSQKGPALVYSDGNVLRAYLMRVLRGLVLPQDYQFRAPPEQGLAGQALDRLLSSLPYPDDELARENPAIPWARTPWVGFRHRMDALYARDFSLKNLSHKTLAAIEDLFGPLNLDTVSQAVHFARYNKITNGAGRNCFVTVTRMKERWPQGGTLSIHGEENGLADVRTLTEMRLLMEAAGLGAGFSTHCVPGVGHQDCLIGLNARSAVFDRIQEFLA